MPSSDLQGLVERLHSGAIDRRAFLRKAAAAGVSLGTATMLASAVGAQATPEATPGASPAASPATGEMTKSITREEYLAQVRQHFGFTDAQTPGGEVIMASAVDFATLNPVVRSDVASLFLLQNMFNQLAGQSVIDGSPVPDLADYWETSGDFLTYTFHLNKTATWHDGKPVTAHDVVFSFEATMDPAGISPFTSNVSSAVASVVALDDHTVQVTAKEAQAVFLNRSVLLVTIVPKHIWEPIPLANWGSAPGSTGTDPSQVIGSGPFRFVEWAQNDHATMERWADYWVPEQLPTIQRATYRVVPDTTTAIQTLKTAESDIVDVPPQQIRDFDGNPDITITRYDEWSWVAFCPNLNPASGTFFLEKDVRQAMMYALDRESMVSSILAGNATVAEGLQPLPSRAYAPDRLSTHYTYDVEKAKSLLEAAGWVDSDGDGIREKDGQKFSTELLFRNTGPISTQVVTYLQQAWKDVGLDIAPMVTEGPSFSDAVITSGKFELALIGISWTEEDQSVLYRTDSWPETGGFNLSRYSNPEFDTLNTAQLTEFDEAKRMAIIEESNNILNDDVAVGVMYFTKGAVGSQNRLHNFAPNSYGSFWLMPFVWVQQ